MSHIDQFCVIGTEEGIGQFMNSEIPRTVCFPAADTAFRIVIELLKEKA